MKCLFWIGLFLPFISSGQERVLEAYIRLGFENNLALKQKNLSWQASLEVLEEARSLFYPVVSLNARYTVADGGRIIDFPVGDLLNPVYSTLNTLTASNAFPMVENQSFPFYRPREQETKIRIVQPLLNNEIYYNRKIRSEYSGLVKADADGYKRTLAAEISKAYYNHLQAGEILEMLQSTRKLAEENLKVCIKLQENGQLARDGVLRAESELAKIDAQIAKAVGEKDVSAAYFNLLLNREPDAEITRDTIFPGQSPEFRHDVQLREEVIMTKAMVNMADHHLSMQKSSKLPDLFAVMDYGFQGEEYAFNNQQDFFMASVVLQWDIFKGFGQNALLRKAKLDYEAARLKLEETSNLVELEAFTAWKRYQAAYAAFISSVKSAELATEAFRMSDKKFREGQVFQLEYLESRNNMTTAQSLKIAAAYSTLSAYAEYERAAGLLKIN